VTSPESATEYLYWGPTPGRGRDRLLGGLNEQDNEITLGDAPRHWHSETGSTRLTSPKADKRNRHDGPLERSSYSGCVIVTDVIWTGWPETKVTVETIMSAPDVPTEP
jgi:hypothetical protein